MTDLMRRDFKDPGHKYIYCGKDVEVMTQRQLLNTVKKLMDSVSDVKRKSK